MYVNANTRIRHAALVVVALSIVAAGRIHAAPEAGTGKLGHPRTSPVYNTWDPTTVVGRSSVERDAGGISAIFQSSTLPPGQPVTLWLGVFNNPRHCATRPCSMSDADNPAVQVDFLWVSGHVVGQNGRGTFAGRVAVGDASRSGLIEAGAPAAAVIGLKDPWKAEIHLLLHAHGPAQMGEDLTRQLSSFLGGCVTVLGGPDGLASGPEDIPDQVGECSTFQVSIHP